MPHWGRPPGARSGRELGRTKNWGEERFQELDSDYDDGEEGMSLVPRSERRGFVSDELALAGVDMDPRPYSGRSLTYEDYEFSEDGEVSGEEGRFATSVSPRDEELLARIVQDRIHQAEINGEPNVSLSQAEYDAWNRKSKRVRPTTRTRERSQSNGYGSDRRRREGIRPTPSPQSVTPERVRRRRPAPYEENNFPYTPSAPPGFVILGPSGTGTFTPVGYYTPPTAQTPSPTPSRHSSRRASLSYAQRGHTPPSPQYQQQYQQSRYSSAPESAPTAIRTPSSAPRTPPTRSPLPHEADWVPRSRSSSSIHPSQAPYPIDPFQFQTYSPPLPPSGQPAVQYAPYGSLRRAPGSGPYTGSPAASVPMSSSPPTLLTPQPTEDTSGGEIIGGDDSGHRVRGNYMPGQWGSDVSARD
ncbi:hypothetical protein GP486_006702 [Trichoglossum hirsutum]|uniref:Uncharacterized protein n=1 Tax=Trichoglossum hirsutum TaxID=265104 RepID=A0A9P8IID3_9PEZI|nr:hypothetical protein GP486_006702 [Trichoglossum hirsutum]